MAYGSYVLGPGTYVQGGVCTGKLEFEIERTVNGDDYNATRDGEKMHWMLADPSTVFEYRMEADDPEQSLTHSSMVLGATLQTENNWLLNASADFFVYRSGTLTGLTLSASKAF